MQTEVPCLLSTRIASNVGRVYMPWMSHIASFVKLRSNSERFGRLSRENLLNLMTGHLLIID